MRVLWTVDTHFPRCRLYKQSILALDRGAWWEILSEYPGFVGQCQICGRRWDM